tara:strand:+ start:1871 stop:2506 length:636 start_codon:yes stop_codon:yes gene_type:complete
MASSFPEPIELNTNANNNRLYLILGVFILLMIIIFSVFFKDNIRNLLLGNIDSVNLEDKIYNNLEEVYNVGKNIYTYDDAHNVCHSLNAKLATHDQVVESYERGAEWCNYGWSQGQNALFPIQKSTWEELQTLPENDRHRCGDKYGVNGGFFENNNLRFGVNCYGIKPEGQLADDYNISSLGKPDIKKLSAEEIGKMGIKPFNQMKWSQHH